MIRKQESWYRRTRESNSLAYALGIVAAIERARRVKERGGDLNEALEAMNDLIKDVHHETPKQIQ